MLQLESWCCFLDEAPNEFRGTGLRESWNADGNVHGRRARSDREKPACAWLECSRIRDLTYIEHLRSTRERNRHRARRDGDVELGAEVSLDRREARADVVVIVRRKIAGLRVDRERAQRAGQSDELEPQLLGMRLLREQQMLQRTFGRTDGMQHPATGDFIARVSRMPRVLARPGATRPCCTDRRFERTSLRAEQGDRALQQLNEIRTRTDAERRPDIGLVDDEPSGAVAAEARQRQRDDRSIELAVEQHAE